MKDQILCERNESGKHFFYLVTAGERIFLFAQDYRKSVQGFYGNGVWLDKSFEFKKSRGDSALVRTMEKIPMYIKYIEKEYGIEVLEQTKKKRSNSNAFRTEIARCA